jgi:PTS system ascorbate-specific IIB component
VATMKRMKVMIVCGFGLGSSMVLKMTLDDVLKEEGLDVETFCMDSYTASGHDFDLVFTSNELLYLFEKNKQPKVVIQNFLSKDEIREKGLDLILDYYKGDE